MSLKLADHMTYTTYVYDTFILDRKSRGLAKNTILYYQNQLLPFVKFLHHCNINIVSAISSVYIRDYLNSLDRNPGGIHAAYRAIKCFLNWYWEEYEPDTPNPIEKVKLPGPKPKPIPGITMEDIGKLIAACTGPLGMRDKAMILLFVDSGLRVSELAALNVGDVDLILGVVQVRSGKGGFSRTVYIGDKTRKQLRRYLKSRPDISNKSPLIPSNQGIRLTRFAIRLIINRRSKKAGIISPGLHDFRRTFALTLLRNKVDLLTIPRLLGHHSLVVTQRYLAASGEDLMLSYRAGSPVDNADL